MLPLTILFFGFLFFWFPKHRGLFGQTHERVEERVSARGIHRTEASSSIVSLRRRRLGDGSVGNVCVRGRGVVRGAGGVCVDTLALPGEVALAGEGARTDALGRQA